MEGTKLSVTGTLNKTDDWIDFSSNEADRTGYYLPIKLTGKKGEAIKMVAPSGEVKVHVFGETGDTDTEMILVIAIKQDAPVKDFTAYSSRLDAVADKNGVAYTLDCSGCTFGV